MDRPDQGPVQGGRTDQYESRHGINCSELCGDYSRFFLNQKANFFETFSTVPEKNYEQFN